MGGNHIQRPVVLAIALVTVLVPVASSAAGPLLASSQSADGGPGADLAWSPVPSPAGAAGWGLGASTSALVASTIHSGSFVSQDRGQTWQPADAGIDEGDIVFDPTDPDRAYFYGFGGLARTTDAGDTWEIVIDTDRSRVATVSPSGTVAASERFGTFENRILISDDGGDTWEDIGAPLPQFTSLYGLAFGPTDDHLVIMAISDTWVTTDGGETWHHDEDNGGRWLARGPDGTLWRAGFDPLQRSTDGGLTWTNIPSPGEGPMDVAETGRLYIASNDGVIFTDDDGATWTNMGYGEISRAATELVVDPYDPEAAFMSDEGVGVTWIGPHPDGGYVLEGRTTGFPPVEVDRIATSQDDQTRLAGTVRGIYISDDAGQTWTHTGAGIGLDRLHGAATADGQTLYAGGQNLIFQPILFSSQDGGASWDVSNPEGNDGVIRDIEADPDDPEHAWAVAWIELGPSSIYETTDGGQTWEAVYTTEVKLWDVAYDPSTATVYAASEVGVVAQDPLTGMWTPRSIASDGSRAVATGAGEVYAEGNPARTLWRGVAEGATFVPWGDVPDRPHEIAVDPVTGASTWTVTWSEDLVACHATEAGLAPTCATDGPDADVTSVVTVGEGEDVVVSTREAGLFAAPIGS